MGPLEGTVILDLSNVVSGPFATYIMALLGADVIKVERPGTGDLARKMGPDVARNKEKMGTCFLASNSGKRSVVLDLKAEGDKAIFRDLVKRADVVFENFRPKAMDKL